MTFGLSYFAVSDNIPEVVVMIERFGCLAKIELIEQVLRQIENFLEKKKKIDTKTAMLGLFEMLRTWKQEEIDALTGMLFVPIALEDCIKSIQKEQEKVPA